MSIIFQIEYLYENGFALGRLLNLNENLEINSKFKIFDIEKIAESKALMTGNKPRPDLFVFCFKNKLNLKKMTIGKVIELL